MFSEIRRFSSPTGALLAYHCALPPGPPRATILVCHGLIEHSARYERFANAMAGRGYQVFAHDHRGHGETRSDEAPLGRFALEDGVDKVMADVKAMRDMVSQESPGLPVILFGHSMGGLIALNAAVTYPKAFQALAIWNSNFNPGLAGHAARLLLAVERMLKGSDVPSGLMPKATFDAWGKSIANRRTEFDWLSRDPEEVDKYASDPLCRFDASVSLWIDVLDLTFRAPTSAMLAHLPKDLPIHLVGGGKDPATRGGREIRWLSDRLKRHGLRHVTTRIYDEMRHETLNEIGWEQAVDDFSAWCEQSLPAA